MPYITSYLVYNDNYTDDSSFCNGHNDSKFLDSTDSVWAQQDSHTLTSSSPHPTRWVLGLLWFPGRDQGTRVGGLSAVSQLLNVRPGLKRGGETTVYVITKPLFPEQTVCSVTSAT